MFIVYSPEGKSFIGASKAVPPLKVDPLKRTDPVEDDVLDGFNMGVELDLKSPKGSAAIHAYETTQKDKARRVVVRVAEIMSTPVKVISSENTLEEAWFLMQENHIQHLPVVASGSLIGICSQRDLLSRMIVSKDGLVEGIKRETVADIMQLHVITTTENTDIRHVATVLTEYEIGALVIMDSSQKPIGVVTRGDMIERLANEPPVELYI